MYITNKNIGYPNNIGNFLSITMILVINLILYYWVLGPDTYFYVDDWGWLDRAVFTPWKDYFSWRTIFPAALFMDRPMEGMAIQGLYDIFGLNHFGFSVAILTIHILNFFMEPIKNV